MNSFHAELKKLVADFGGILEAEHLHISFPIGINEESCAYEYCVQLSALRDLRNVWGVRKELEECGCMSAASHDDKS
jgi:hypothetical protein